MSVVCRWCGEESEDFLWQEVPGGIAPIADAHRYCLSSVAVTEQSTLEQLLESAALRERPLPLR